MNNMKNNKVKICSALIAIGTIISMWSKKDFVSFFSDKLSVFSLLMMIIILATIVYKQFFSKKKS